MTESSEKNLKFNLKIYNQNFIRNSKPALRNETLF